MSIVTYETAHGLVDYNTDNTIVAKEVVALLVAHTPCTIYAVEEDTDTKYRVVVDSGDGAQYFEFYAQNAYRGPANLRRGHLYNGAFSSEEVIEANTNVFDTGVKGWVKVANNGAAWAMRFMPGLYAGCVHITPQDESTPIPACGINYYSGIPVFPSSYSFRYHVRLGVSDYLVGSFYVDTAANNFVNGEVLMMPTMVGINCQTPHFGIPTIGGKHPYYCSVPVDPFVEYRVAGTWYVSLGNVAIESI